MGQILQDTLPLVVYFNKCVENIKNAHEPKELLF